VLVHQSRGGESFGFAAWRELVEREGVMRRRALDATRYEDEAPPTATLVEPRVQTCGPSRLLAVASATVAGSAEPEQRVIRQLLEALLFEGLIAYQTGPRPVDERTHAYPAIYDLQLDLRLGAEHLRCLGTIGAFDRVRIAQGSCAWASAGQPRDLSLREIIRSLDIGRDGSMRLLEELEQTLALCRWNGENLTVPRAPRRGLGFQQLESAIVEGHPYHPCFKARTGFSLRDHRDYGPEAGNTFQLEWLAVAKSSLRSALPHDEAVFWRKELGERAFGTLTGRLADRGRDWGAYSLVPVHPWQLRALGKHGLERAVEQRAVMPLGVAGDRYQATQSVRTLVNVSHPEKANVKLPLDIVSTSSRRNFQQHFVCTAPALSDWLASMVERDAFLRAEQSLLLLKEYAAVVYETDVEALSGQLGAIYRESVCSKLGDGEAAVPFTALTVVESDGRPFIADWVEQYGVSGWAERLLEVMLIPLWHMLVHHGVAFEAHAQNLVLLHRDGWPQKIALRDFHQETEYVADYLRDPTAVPDFAQIDPYFSTVPDDDGYRMASTEALRELFMDCVYIFNLADLSFLLARFYGLAELDFWSLVRTLLSNYEHSGITASSRISRIASSSREIVVESLLKKKIMNGGVLDFFEHRVRNTLHGKVLP
jgi:siderophore synthetase component